MGGVRLYICICMCDVNKSWLNYALSIYIYIYIHNNNFIHHSFVHDAFELKAAFQNTHSRATSVRTISQEDCAVA